MTQNLYAVYDKKAETELGIFEQPNDLVAIRDFSQVCSKPDHQIAKFAEDYCLVYIGKINTTTMAIESEVKTIAEAKDYVKSND